MRVGPRSHSWCLTGGEEDGHTQGRERREMAKALEGLDDKTEWPGLPGAARSKDSPLEKPSRGTRPSYTFTLHVDVPEPGRTDFCCFETSSMCSFVNTTLAR